MLRSPSGSGPIEPSFVRFRASFHDATEKTCWDNVDPALITIPLPVALRCEPLDEALGMFGILGMFAGAPIAALTSFALARPLSASLAFVFMAFGIAACIALRLRARCWYLFPWEREKYRRKR